MRFGRQSKETSLVSENYTPGPGFYLGNDQRYSNILKYSHPYYGGQDLAMGFSREMRFHKSKQTEVKPGPGSYNFGKQFLSQKEFTAKYTSNPHLQRIGTSNSAAFQNNNNQNFTTTFKVNSVPSIPSAHFSPGYQEIRDGLVIQLKDQTKQAQENRVGPGSYDPKIETIRPRKATTVIRSQSNSAIKLKKLSRSSVKPIIKPTQPNQIDLCLVAHKQFFG